MRRALFLLPPLAAASLAIPQGAAAQSPCGSSYRVERGDTLYSIARRCRTSTAEIVRANPFISHPGRIEVGWRLALPGGSGGPDEPVGQETYRVGPGETLYSISARLGLRVADLIAANPGIDPRNIEIGDILYLPGYQPPDAASPDPLEARISPGSAAPGEAVTIRARGFRPHEPVRIGAGPPRTEFDDVVQARADGRGRIEARVRVPDWADPGRRLEWVVYDRYRNEALVEDFLVAGSPDDGAGDEGLEVTGIITREGVECPALRSDTGELYTLAGDTGRFRPGDRVTVRGRGAETSFCMQGTTIAVEEIEPAGWDR